ncbi:MAG: hypothetical protein U0930_02775 [Pirellulales bacterium]
MACAITLEFVSMMPHLLSIVSRTLSPKETIMYGDPLAYFITWTCYGTWLPGDNRGGFKWKKGQQIPQPLLVDWVREELLEPPVFLDEAQRQVVENTIVDHCQRRQWHLHAKNCRTNHCHVVVTAKDRAGIEVRDQLKSWCKRKLKELQWTMAGVELLRLREHWWTKKGCVRLLFDNESLEAAVIYTLEAQGEGGSKFA